MSVKLLNIHKFPLNFLFVHKFFSLSLKYKTYLKGRHCCLRCISKQATNQNQNPKPKAFPCPKKEN